MHGRPSTASRTTLAALVRVRVRVRVGVNPNPNPNPHPNPHPNPNLGELEGVVREELDLREHVELPHAQRQLALGREDVLLGDGGRVEPPHLVRVRVQVRDKG